MLEDCTPKAVAAPLMPLCIDMNEARSMGLKVEELEQDELAMVWEIYRLYKEKDKMKPAKK